MDLSFFPLTLDAMDQAAAESLCLFIAADERPLTGLSGLVDWRLTGRLSRLLRGGLLTGDAGEAVLTQPGTRLARKDVVGAAHGKREPIAFREHDAGRPYLDIDLVDLAGRERARLRDTVAIARARKAAGERVLVPEKLRAAAMAPVVSAQAVEVPV